MSKNDIIAGSTIPQNPDMGQIFYNITDNSMYVYDATAWVKIGERGELDNVIVRTKMLEYMDKLGDI